MCKTGTLTLTVALISGLFGIGLSVCRDFMDMECSAQMARASQNMDHCQRMCQLGQDESPAVLEKAQPQSSFSAPVALAEHYIVPLGSHVRLIHRATKVEVDNPLPPGEVYLLNTSFLI